MTSPPPSVACFTTPSLLGALPHPHHCTRTTPTARYQLAITRRVPRTFASGLLAPGSSSNDINLSIADAQHASYIDILRRYVDRVVVLPALDAFPDSVFVEDAAVVLPPAKVASRDVSRAASREVSCEASRAASEKVVLQTSPGHPTRRAEAELLAPDLRSCGVRVVELALLPQAVKDAGASHLDGGDILYAHAHRALFVGLSERTGSGAPLALQHASPTVRVIPITMPTDDDTVLHLKSCVTWVEHARRFVVADTPTGRSVYAQISNALRSTNAVWVPPEAAGAANVLDLGTCVVLPAAYWGALRDVRSVLRDAGVEAVACEFGEFAKANGSLTCCSILVP